MQTSYSNHLCAVESGSGEGQGDWITQEKVWDAESERSWQRAGNHTQLAWLWFSHSLVCLCSPPLASSCSSPKHLHAATLDLCWPLNSATETQVLVLRHFTDTVSVSMWTVCIFVFIFWLFNSLLEVKHIFFTVYSHKSTNLIKPRTKAVPGTTAATHFYFYLKVKKILITIPPELKVTSSSCVSCPTNNQKSKDPLHSLSSTTKKSSKSLKLEPGNVWRIVVYLFLFFIE